MNSENSKTFDYHRLLLDLSDKIDFRRKDKYIAISNLDMEKYKKVIIIMNLKYQLQHRMKNLNYLMDHILYKTLKQHVEKTVNAPIKIYINKIENRITFKIKTGFYLELLTPETTKLLDGTKSKTRKDKNGKNVPYLEITKAVLIHCNVLNNNYQQNSRAFYKFVTNK